MLQNAGPRSPSAMPEAGFLPIPKKLLEAGVKDMVRISDARMSGTAYGTIVLHVAPEAAVGGPLAYVRNGDKIRLSVKERRLDLLVEESELQRRRASHGVGPAGSDTATRGYDKLFRECVLQAPEGCDFDFLRAVGVRPCGSPTSDPELHHRSAISGPMRRTATRRLSGSAASVSTLGYCSP